MSLRLLVNWFEFIPFTLIYVFTQSDPVNPLSRSIYLCERAFFFARGHPSDNADSFFSLDYLIYRDEWIKFDTMERLLIKFFLLSVEIVQIDCAVN